MQLEPIVISSLQFDLTNSNSFPAESTALYTSCSPLLGNFMADKEKSPTLSFLDVPVPKMFFFLSVQQGAIQKQKNQETDEGAHVQENDQSKKEHFVPLHQTYPWSQCFVSYFLDKHRKQVNSQRDS